MNVLIKKLLYYKFRWLGLNYIDKGDNNMANEDGKKISRRRFVKNSSYAAGGIIGGGLLGSFLGFNWDKSDDDTSAPATENPNKALMYFTNQAEFNTLSEATERIFPKNDSATGAMELGGHYFSDHQLAGSYGYHTQAYMQGTCPQGSPYQGYQTPLKRNEIFVEAIRSLDRESYTKVNAAFRDIEDGQRDQILMN